MNVEALHFVRTPDRYGNSMPLVEVHVVQHMQLRL